MIVGINIVVCNDPGIATILLILPALQNLFCIIIINDIDLSGHGGKVLAHQDGIGSDIQAEERMRSGIGTTVYHEPIIRPAISTKTKSSIGFIKIFSFAYRR
jgi:hypothetical protein